MSEDSMLAEKIKTLAINYAKDIYGNDLPQAVEMRIKYECNCIVRTQSELQFEILNIAATIAAKNKTYIVLRGSVGNSFVAFLLGNTLVNPLEDDDYILSPEFLFRTGEKREIVFDIDCDKSIQKEVMEAVKILVGKDAVFEEPQDNVIKMRKVGCNVSFLCFLPPFGRLQAETNTKLHEIPLNDKEVLRNCKLKGLRFKCTTFDELVTAFGLVHGTGTCNRYTRKLLSNGNVEFNELIAYRDDVFECLINGGIEGDDAYRIAKLVWWGKDLDFEDIELMKTHNISDWIIHSCESVSYLFPKAHGIAYSKIIYWEQWYKKYFPKEYRKYINHTLDSPENYNLKTLYIKIKQYLYLKSL